MGSGSSHHAINSTATATSTPTISAMSAIDPAPRREYSERRKAEQSRAIATQPLAVCAALRHASATLSPRSARAQKMFDRLAHCAVAAVGFCSPSGDRANFRTRIGRRHRVAACVEDRKVGQIVAHECDLARFHLKRRAEFIEQRNFVFDVLVHHADTEVEHA